MLRQFLFLLIALTVLNYAAYAQPIEKRFALLIGNQSYEPEIGRLVYPQSDVENIKSALVEARFPEPNIITIFDADQTRIRAAVAEFSDRLNEHGDDAIGFFYYSGHGGSAENNGVRRNFLIPTHEPIAKADDLYLYGVALEDVIDSLAATEAEAVFIVSDACRNTLPFTSDRGTARDRGMVPVARRPGLFIGYSTAEGQVAPDDGVYAEVLAKFIRRPNLTVDRAFTLAMREITLARKSSSAPYTVDGLKEDICFVSCAEVPVLSTISRYMPKPVPETEDYDISMLPSEVRSIVNQARINQITAKRNASRAEEIKILAELASEKAREVSSGEPVSGYAEFKGSNGDQYSGQVWSERNGSGGFDFGSDGYGVSIAGPGKYFGDRRYCRFVRDKGCGQFGVYKYSINENNESAKLDFWSGQFTDEKRVGFGYLRWQPQPLRQNTTEAWYFSGAESPIPGVWIEGNGRKYEGEIKTNWEGLGVLWREDRSLHSFGLWKNGRLFERWNAEWELWQKIEESEQGSQFRIASNLAFNRSHGEAYEIYNTLCEQDFPPACHQAGRSLFQGLGINIDKNRGVELLKKACALGIKNSCGAVGDSYDEGWLGKTDHRLALSFYRKACDNRLGLLKFCNMSAWLASTSPDLNPTEAQTAITHAKWAVAQYPEHFDYVDTLAAAYAAAGNFDAAVSIQTLVIELGGTSDEFTERLAQYRQGKRHVIVRP